MGNTVLIRKKWLIYPVSAALIISGVVFVPFSLPITSLESYLQNEYPYEKKDIEGGEYAVKEERYSQLKWTKTLCELKIVLDSLPESQKENT